MKNECHTRASNPRLLGIRSNRLNIVGINSIRQEFTQKLMSHAGLEPTSIGNPF